MSKYRRLVDAIAPSCPGWYELWFAVDGSQSSLFMPAQCSQAQYHLMTHELGYGDGDPAFPGDRAEDRPMKRVARFWAPHRQVARLVRWAYERRRRRSHAEV
jgi:hypothetical protein